MSDQTSTTNEPGSESTSTSGNSPYTLSVPDVVALEQMIAADGTPLYELMKHAGGAIAQAALAREPKPTKVLVLAGSGNNGGDGWVAAELLAQQGMATTVVSPKEPAALTTEPAHTAALHAVETCGDGGDLAIIVTPEASRLDELLAEADLVIDAILGTGFAHDTLREPYAGWVDALNAERGRRGLYVIAADVPSGLSAQTGAAAKPHVMADETITMMVLKPGLFSEEGRRACGEIHVADICDLAPYQGYLEEHKL